MKVVVFQWPWGTPTRSRSPRRQRPCVRAMLVEAQVSSIDETLGIEIELLLEPGLAALPDIRPIMLAGVRGLFLRVMAWRAKKRRIVCRSRRPGPYLASVRRNSSIAMSGVSSTRARIVAPCASTRPERRSPPWERGPASPRSRSSDRQRLTLAALTPNRSPACRWLKPFATAAKTRTRRSSDRALGMSAGLRRRVYPGSATCGFHRHL